MKFTIGVIAFLLGAALGYGLKPSACDHNFMSDSKFERLIEELF